MQDVASLNFLDFSLNAEAWVGIRAERDLIAVCFSLRRHGDIELMLRSEEWQQFLVSLQRAIAIAKATERNESEEGFVVKEVVNLQFVDYDSNDEASIFIRVKRDLIEVGFSLKDDDRDVQLVLRSEEWEQFLTHLQRAIEIAKAPEAQ